MGFMTRNGKIARLPRAIRDELNRRLQDGEPGKHLLHWLNHSEKVRTILDREFGGRPISEQNLCEYQPNQTESNQIKPNQTKSN